MEDQIKESLCACSEQNLFQMKAQSSRYNKSNSFTEFSDWSNKHRYINQSIVLPRIMENPLVEQPVRNVQSSLSTYEPVRKLTPSITKPVQIKFALPEGLKGFQKSFYENYIKEKTDRKGSRSRAQEFISIQEQLKGSGRRRKSVSMSISNNKQKLQIETARQSIINQVMNRKNRLKRQHILQEFLIANQMEIKSDKPRPL